MRESYTAKNTFLTEKCVIPILQIIWSTHTGNDKYVIRKTIQILEVCYKKIILKEFNILSIGMHTYCLRIKYTKYKRMHKKNKNFY